MTLYEKRKEKILRFIKSLEEKGIFIFNRESFDSRIKLQKYVYLYSKLEEDMGYSFNLYLHGPYSPNLARDYYSIDREELEKAEGMNISERYLELIRGKDARWLELAATYLSVKARNPDKGLDKVCEHVNRIKPWAKINEVRRIAEEIKRLYF